MQRAIVGLALVVGFAVALAAPAVRAQPAPVVAAAPRLVIGTHPVPPFVVHAPDGSWHGISMDLWAQLAARLHLEYDVRELSLAELAPGHDPGVDVIVSMNITAAREQTFDLTHAFYTTGLAIATRPHASSPWRGLLHKLLTPGALGLALGLVGLLIGAATVMWLLERRRNPDEFGGVGSGLVAGVMWSVETVIGYNDPQHKTRRGRAFGILWAVVGVIFVSALTAQLSAQLTVNQLESGIRGPADLARARVGTVRPSAGSVYCDRRALHCAAYPDAEAAIDALARGEVDALVYEAPILQYLAATRPSATGVRVLDGTFDNHGYGFALREGSTLREPVNRALLEVITTEDWRALLGTYLGGTP